MLTRSKGRTVRDLAEAQELLSAWTASEQPMSDWCAARGINWRSLSTFTGKLGKLPVPTDFVEVNLSEALPMPSLPARYELHLGDGRHLVLGDDFSQDTLARILAVVQPC